MRELYEEYMRTNPKAPSKEQLCYWVKEAWGALSAEMIQNSFKVCGMTNELTGTEDDKIKCLKDFPDALSLYQTLRQTQAEETENPYVYISSSDSESDEDSDVDDDENEFLEVV